MAEDTDAVWMAYNAAELKAETVREECGPAPIDHAAQAAIESSDATGAEFQAAYDEVFQTVHKIVTGSETTTEASQKIRRIKLELL